MRFLHCSDIHITGDYSQVPLATLGWRRTIARVELWRGRQRLFRDAAQTVATMMRDAERLNVDHVIVSGDLTAYGLPEEFEGARAALEPFASDRRRCTVIPGNHDTYTPETVNEKLFEKHFGGLLISDMPEHATGNGYPFVRFVGDEVAIVGLLSARVPLVPGFSFGVVGDEQRRALEAIVADVRVRQRALFVVVHHAPLTRNERADKPLHGLVDAAALCRSIGGERFTLFHGHIHRRYTHAPTFERPRIFGAGSSTQAGREGYWLIETEGARVTKFEARRPGQLD